MLPKRERDEFVQPPAHPPHLAVQHFRGGQSNLGLSSSFSSSIPYRPYRGDRGICQRTQAAPLIRVDPTPAKKRARHFGALPPETAGAGRGFST